MPNYLTRCLVNVDIWLIMVWKTSKQDWVFSECGSLVNEFHTHVFVCSPLLWHFIDFFFFFFYRTVAARALHCELESQNLVFTCRGDVVLQEWGQAFWACGEFAEMLKRNGSRSLFKVKGKEIHEQPAFHCSDLSASFISLERTSSVCLDWCETDLRPNFILCLGELRWNFVVVNSLMRHCVLWCTRSRATEVTVSWLE